MTVLERAHTQIHHILLLWMLQWHDFRWKWTNISVIQHFCILEIQFDFILYCIDRLYYGESIYVLYEEVEGNKEGEGEREGGEQRESGHCLPFSFYKKAIAMKFIWTISTHTHIYI